MLVAFRKGALIVAPEAESPDPIVGGMRILFAGKLHYRRPGADDGAAAALDAYRSAGLDGLCRLEGAFALILIDPARDLVIGYRDPLGAIPLFWRQCAEEWALGSSRAALGAGDGLDLGHLADRLIVASANPDWLASTPFPGINRLRPGRFALFHLGPGAPEIRAGWDWQARIAEERIAGPDAAAREYRARLGEAVRERIGRHPAAQLSGGMDSSSVALLACRHAPRVTGLALTFDASAELRDERRWIDLVRDPRLDVHCLAGDALVDFSAFAGGARHDEPTPWLFRTGQDEAMLGLAARLGADTILTGEGADEILAMPPLEILAALKRLDLGTAHALAARWARAHGTTLWRVLASLGAIGSRFAPRLAAARPPPWLAPDFVKAVDWSDRVREPRRARLSKAADLRLSHLIAEIDLLGGDWIGNALARPLGVDLAHPFKDPRVIAFGAAARLALGGDPGHPKPLLAAAMKGVVAEPILARRDKTSFAPLTYLGFRRHRAELADLALHGPAALDAVFDRDALSDAIAEAALGYQPLAELHRLAAALGIAKWIDRLSEASSPGRSDRESHAAPPPLDPPVGHSSDRIASA